MLCKNIFLSFLEPAAADPGFPASFFPIFCVSHDWDILSHMLANLDHHHTLAICGKMNRSAGAGVNMLCENICGSF